ncbi:Chymotrypsin-like protease CTRL-1, partial [Fragariocoptes setiger]
DLSKLDVATIKIVEASNALLPFGTNELRDVAEAARAHTTTYQVSSILASLLFYDQHNKRHEKLTVCGIKPGIRQRLISDIEDQLLALAKSTRAAPDGLPRIINGIESMSRFTSWRLYLGDHNVDLLDTNELVMDVDLAVLHRDFQGLTETEPLLNDIGMLRLSRSIDYMSTRIEPICMSNKSHVTRLKLESELDRLDGPFDRRQYRTNTRCVSLGWGITEEPANDGEADLSPGARTLQQLDMRVLNIVGDHCEQNDGIFTLLTQGFFCAAPVSGSSPGSVCRGDSGGPLVCRESRMNRWYLIGLTSNGPKRCTRRSEHSRWSAVHTDVAYYMPWVNSVISQWSNAEPPPPSRIGATPIVKV